MPLSGMYVLQGVVPSQIAAAPFNVKVVETTDDNGTAFTASQVSTMESGGGTVLGYFSLGEAENFRDYFSSLPSSIVGPADPSWPGDYQVAYWTPQWEAVAKAQIDKMIAAGYNGIYFDVVDEYQMSWAAKNAPGGDAAGAMKTLVEDLSAYAKAQDPGFQIWVNGAEELLTGPKYLNSIDGMLKENLYYNSDGSAPNSASDVQYSVNYLHLATAAGKPVIDVEYTPGNAQAIANVESQAAKDGFGAYIAHLDLNGIDYTDNAVSPATGLSSSSSSGASNGGTTTQPASGSGASSADTGTSTSSSGSSSSNGSGNGDTGSSTSASGSGSGSGDKGSLTSASGGGSSNGSGSGSTGNGDTSTGASSTSSDHNTHTWHNHSSAGGSQAGNSSPSGTGTSSSHSWSGFTPDHTSPWHYQDQSAAVPTTQAEDLQSNVHLTTHDFLVM